MGVDNMRKAWCGPEVGSRLLKENQGAMRVVSSLQQELLYVVQSLIQMTATNKM